MATLRRQVRSDKPSSAGSIKLAVYFKDHRDTNGRPKTFWGNKKYPMDKQITRLRNLVTAKWSGKVDWAAIYDCSAGRFGKKIAEFKNGTWHANF